MASTPYVAPKGLALGENQATVLGGQESELWDDATVSAVRIPADTITPGQVFSLRAWGIMTTADDAGQTFSVTPYYGTDQSGTILGASRTADIREETATDVPWALEMIVNFRTIGVSGAATCSGTFNAYPVIDTVKFGTNSATPTEVDTIGDDQALYMTVTPSLISTELTTLGIVVTTVN